MPIPSSISDLSATAASNSPLGSDPPTEGDNHIRALAAIVRQVYDDQTDIATNYVNVKGPTYGALGDGSNDDTAEIQAALSTGLDVFVPATSSYYKISAALTMLDGQRIFGEGERSEIRQITTDLNVISATSKSDCIVEGLNLYAIGTKGTLTTGAGVLFDTCSRCKAIGNIVQNHRGGGVVLNSTNDSEVRGNVFISSPVADLALNDHTAGDILLIRSSSRNVVAGNVCKSGQGVGIYVQTIATGQSCNDNAITGNVVQDCKAYGIMLYRNEDSATATEHVKGNSVVGNTIRNTTGTIENAALGTYTFGAGIYIQGAEDSTIAGNTIIGSHQGAVTFAESLAPGAIGCTNVTRFTVVGNVIQDCDMFGIDVGDASSFGNALGFGVVADNIITNCVKAGINVRNRGRLIIKGNAVDTTANSGIRVNNTSIKEQISITGNTVRNTTGTALIELNYADGCVVMGNNVDTGNTSGITAANCVAPIISNNVIKNHSTRGIQIVSTSTQSSVFGNYIEGTGSSTEGIRLDAVTRYAGNDISGCTAVYAGNFGPYHTLTVDSTTPSVEDGSEFITNNTVGTTITNFTNGYEGQEITVVFTDANTTLDFTASNLKGNNGVDRAMAAGDAIFAKFRAGGVNVWYVTIIDI